MKSILCAYPLLAVFTILLGCSKPLYFTLDIEVDNKAKSPFEVFLKIFTRENLVVVKPGHKESVRLDYKSEHKEYDFTVEYKITSKKSYPVKLHFFYVPSCVEFVAAKAEFDSGLMQDVKFVEFKGDVEFASAKNDLYVDDLSVLKMPYYFKRHSLYTSSIFFVNKTEKNQSIQRMLILTKKSSNEHCVRETGEDENSIETTQLEGKDWLVYPVEFHKSKIFLQVYPRTLTSSKGVDISASYICNDLTCSNLEKLKDGKE